MNIEFKEYNGVFIGEKERMRWAHWLYKILKTPTWPIEENVQFIISGNHLMIGYTDIDNTVVLYDCVVNKYWISDYVDNETVPGAILIF